jgi:hypothetical protein
MGEIQRHAKGMDAKVIDIKKSNLIKDVNYTFGQGFFSEHRVPEYRLLASIQQVVDAYRGSVALLESVSKIQLEEGLVRYMMTRGDFAEKVAQKSEVDQLVMQMVAKRFNEKYSGSLIGPQKVLLEKYIRFQVTGDERPMSEFIDFESLRISRAMDRAMAMKEVDADPEMRKKLVEAKERFDRPFTGPIEKTVEDVMMYQKLAEEIDSDD